MLHNDIYVLLGRLKANIRLYLALETSARVFAAVAVFCWVSLALDYSLEMGLWLRAVLLALAGLGILGYVLSVIFGRLTAGLPLHRLALTVETLVPKLGDRLISALELAQLLAAKDVTFSRSLAEDAMRSAAEAVRGVQARDLMDYQRLRRILAVSFALIVSWAVFAYTATGPSDTWFRRNILLDATVQWPHLTSLQVLGFIDGKVLVARGDDFPVKVAVGGEIPSKVQIRYRMTDSRTRGRAYLLKVGETEFLHRFAGLLEPVEFQVRGGDDYEGPFFIQTVPPPTLLGLSITCRYPDYTGMATETLVDNALVYTLPYGTQLEFKGLSNKDLAQVTTTAGTEKRAFVPQAPREFFFSLDLLETLSLQIALRDQQGIENREARSLTLVARPDQPPTIDASLHGVRQSITAKAVIPFLGAIQDEYGIMKAEFLYRVEAAEEKALPFSRPPEGAREVPLRERFGVAPLQLEPGKKLQLQIGAEDGNTLSGPKAGKSRIFGFEIVTPDELLSQIAARELNLRRRFERSLEEMREANENLIYVGQEHPKPDADLSMLKLHAERVLLSSRKNLNEVAGVSQAFQEILLELQNNGINIETLLQRIEQGVCIPLTDITTNGFPALADSVQKLSASLARKENIATSAEEAQQSARILIQKMEQVLAAMLNLESFNEALELLRSIISLQHKVENETKDAHKKKIQDLLK
jgi:hypothetical protein